MKSLKNSNINPENLENLALIIPRDSRLAQSREIRDPVTRLESLDSCTVKSATANITRVRFALEPHMLFSEMPVGIGPCGIFAPAYLAENRAIILY